MAKQIITVLCEGPHDVAFITKILKTIGFMSNENIKIADYPYPLNDLLKKEVVKTNVEALNLQEVRQTLLPSNTLIRGENYLFLYSMGGDSKSDSRKQILDKLKQAIPKETGEIPEALLKDTNLSLIYILDADDKGVEKRLEYLNKEINEVMGEEPFTYDRRVKISNKIKLGSLIFTGSNGNEGKLEDILVPLMQKDNESIFENAKKYLSDHYDETRIKKYDEPKSIVGIVGQLQKSGGSNVVCIGQTDYLTPDKIHSDIKCQEIIAFFEEFITF